MDSGTLRSAGDDPQLDDRRIASDQPVVSSELDNGTKRRKDPKPATCKTSCCSSNDAALKAPVDRGQQAKPITVFNHTFRPASARFQKNQTRTVRI